MTGGVRTIAEFEAAARNVSTRSTTTTSPVAPATRSPCAPTRARFARLCLLPRILRGSDKRRAAVVTLFGCAASMPILLSPTAFHRLAHPDGELATARAAALAPARS